MAVKAGKTVRDIRIEELQNTLIDQGAEIGQSLGEPDYEAIERFGQLPFEEEESTSGEGDPVTQGAWIGK